MGRPRAGFGRKIYPGNTRIVFDGGLNNKFARGVLPDNESPDCLNVVFENGTVGTREGSSKLNTAAAGSFVCDGLYTRQDNDGSESMIAFFGGDMFRLSGTTWATIPSAQSYYTAGNRIATEQAENYMFMCDGTQNPYKYNGTDWTRHGIPAPTQTAVAASNGTGNVTGSVSYKYTNVNTALVEGDLSPVVATITVSNASVTITNIAVAPQSHGVNQRKIYRTEAGGSTYKLVGTISDNITTTFNDNVADASLGATAPTDQGEPPKFKAIVYHSRRLFFIDDTNPNYLQYTELDNPYVVKATNFLRIGDKTADLPQALGVYENGVMVFGERGNEFIYMPDTDPSNWVVVRGKSKFGSKSPFGVVNFNNKLFFPAVVADKFIGFANVIGATVEPSATTLSILTAGSDTQSDKIEPDMFKVQEAYLKNISSIVFQNKVYTTLTWDTGNTTNNRIYVYDFSISNISKKQEFAWSPWSGLNISQFTIYDGKLYGGSSVADGFVYQLEDSSYNDDGSAIDSYYWTKEFDGAEPGFRKDLRQVNMLVDLAGSYNMGVNVRKDGINTNGNAYTVDITPVGSLWDTAQWDTDQWDGESIEDNKRLYLSEIGNRFQFRFDNGNTADQRFKVHNMDFAYNTKGFR